MYTSRRPRDAFRSRTYDLIADLHEELRRDGLLPGLSRDELEIRAGRLAKSQLYRNGLLGPGKSGLYVRRTRGREPDLLDLAFDAARRALPDGAANTGREFSYNFVHLVDHLLGKEAGRRTRAAYKAARLKYSKPKILSEDQKLAATERLVRNRADKVVEDILDEIRKEL
jgi:hypothetical protein